MGRCGNRSDLYASGHLGRVVEAALGEGFVGKPWREPQVVRASGRAQALSPSWLRARCLRKEASMARYDLSETEQRLIQPLLPNNSRGGSRECL